MFLEDSRLDEARSALGIGFLPDSTYLVTQSSTCDHLNSLMNPSVFSQYNVQYYSKDGEGEGYYMGVMMPFRDIAFGSVRVFVFNLTTNQKYEVIMP